MDQGDDKRINNTISAMIKLRAKVDETVEKCGGQTQVGVICYAHDAVSPLFYGNPSLKQVVERYSDVNPPRTSLETVQALDQAMENLNLQNLSPHERRSLRDNLLHVHHQIADNNNNNQG